MSHTRPLADCFVNITELPGSADTTRYFPVSLLADPATNEELGTPDMGLSETKEAIEAAAKAFTTWSKTTAKVGPRLRLPMACTH